MTNEERNEIYDSVSNYWFSGGKQFDGNVDEWLKLIASKHGQESTYHACRYMLDLGFDLGPNVVDYM